MFKKLLNLLSDSAVYGLSGSFGRLMGLILIPLVARAGVGPADYAIVFMLSIVGMVFAPFANLGMRNAVFRRFNVSKDPAYRARVLTTGLVSNTITSLVLFLACQLFASDISTVMVGDDSATHLVRVSLIGSLATAIGSIFAVALRAARRTRTAAAMNMLKVAVYAGVTLFLVKGLDLGIYGVIVGGVAGEVIGTIAQLLFTFREFRARPDWQLWREMLSYGMPFVPHQLQMAGLEMFGLYMVREMLGMEAAGLYGIAARFSSPVSLVVNAVQTSWVPYKFEIHANDENPKEFFQSAMVYYMAGLSYLWMGVAIWGPEVIRLLLPPSYLPATAIIWATTLVPTAHGIYFMIGTGIELGNTRRMPIVSLIGLGSVVLAAFLLVEPLGALGAALATTLGWLAMAGTIYYLSQKQFPIDYDWTTIAAFVALALTFVVIGQSIQSQPAFVRLATLVGLSLAYPVLLTLVLLRSRDERNRMQHLLQKLRIARFA